MEVLTTKKLALAVLKNIEEYFENKADVEAIDGAYKGNKEAHLFEDVRLTAKVIEREVK